MIVLPPLASSMGQNRHRRVVAVGARRRQHVAADQFDQRRQRRSGGTDPVGEGRDVEIDAFAGEALALALSSMDAPRLPRDF